ncbi:hypothetical protein IJS77_01725 [bacterium]|nr:hypothetical protein [bacterium]
MKRILSFILISAFAVQTLACAEETLNLGNDEIQKIKLNPAIEAKTDKIILNDEVVIRGVIMLQQEKDLEDIDMLWKEAVERNTLIKFALKKLASPDSQRRIHSSLMAKTVSALVSGASFLPSFAGSNTTIQTGAYAAGHIISSLITNRTMPKENPLTDTELIELAGVIEDLQDDIIQSYYGYKSSLSQIKDTREQIILYNKNFNNATKNQDTLEMFLSEHLYEKAILKEEQQTYQAKKYLLELQRLSGDKAIEKLNLYQYTLKNELLDPSTFKNKEQTVQ